MYPHEFNRDGERIESPGPTGSRSTTATPTLTAVLGGFGLSQVITFMAEPYLASGELVQVLPEWTREPLPVTWCIRPTAT